jgi:hypothetical protein
MQHACSGAGRATCRIWLAVKSRFDAFPCVRRSNISFARLLVCSFNPMEPRRMQPGATVSCKSRTAILLNGASSHRVEIFETKSGRVPGPILATLAILAILPSVFIMSRGMIQALVLLRPSLPPGTASLSHQRAFFLIFKAWIERSNDEQTFERAARK